MKTANKVLDDIRHYAPKSSALSLGQEIMKLICQRFHPVALVVTMIFFALAIRVVVQGEREGKRRDDILRDLQRKNPAEVAALRDKLDNVELAPEEREDIQREIEWRVKHGWRWTSALLPGNARNPARAMGVALAAIGVVCSLYRRKAPQPANAAYRR